MESALPLIDGERLWSRLMALAQIGATGHPGEVNRQALTDEDAQACAQVIDWGRAAGLSPAFDPAGNLFLTLPGTATDLPPVLCGSHLDSQPTGGRFDGVLGVLAALEAASAIAGGPRPARSVVVVAWSNEEGGRFAPGMSGSAAFAGQRELASVRDARDANDMTQGAALDRFFSRFADVPRLPLGFPIAAYLELHIEQATMLESAAAIIGAVTGIQGKMTWEITLTGAEAHAGTEPMARRKDALAAFARVAHTLDTTIAAQAPDAMFTIGRLEVHPNAPSVVPAEARFRVDLRHADAPTLTALGTTLERIVATHAPPCAVSVRKLIDAPPNAFSVELRRAIRAAADAHGFPVQDLLSAAGHDARHIATVTDHAAMIFIPCRNGLSHHPDEWADPAHVAAGAQVLCDLLVSLHRSGS